jgi:hypothetical protein
MAILYVKLMDGKGMQAYCFRTLREAREVAREILTERGVQYAIAIRG